MAVDKLVDSAVLNSNLTSVANAIRTKGGTSEQLAFPAEFVSAIGAIPSGGGGLSLLNSGTYTQATGGISTINIPVTYTGTPYRVFVKEKEALSGTAQSYAWVIDIFNDNNITAAFNNKTQIGIAIAISSSNTFVGPTYTEASALTQSAITIQRVNNANLIQANDYEWYIYGVAA